MDGSNTRLRLRVSPGAASAGIVGRYGDAWKVRVTSAPERGRANQALLAVLAEALRIPRARLQLVLGESARDKVVSVSGLSQHEAERRLAVAAGG